VTGTDERQQRLDAWLALQDPDPDFAGTVVLPMLTGSMAPRIPVGARLLIAAARRTPFGVGHVVVFVRGDKLVAHRLILALGRGPDARFVEKGDWNPAAGLVRRRDIRGVVTGYIPAGPADAAPIAVGRSRAAAWASLWRAVVARILGRHRLEDTRA